jgi:hypothetical protein
MVEEKITQHGTLHNSPRFPFAISFFYRIITRRAYAVHRAGRYLCASLLPF